jgi:hypothetical protein
MLLHRLYDDGLALSPDYPHAKLVWDCLLERIVQWLRPKTAGIHKTEHRLTLITGQQVQFLSGHVEKIVRGHGGGWGGIDEEKDIPTDIVDHFIPCIRTSNYFPLIFGVGTPEAGTDFEERWNQTGELKDYCKQYSFPAQNNCFIDGEIWEIAKSLMDEKRYAQEVLAEFVELEEKPYICRDALGPHHAIDDYDVAADITKRLSAKKTGHSCSYIAGVDYNQDAPNVAWIYKVYYPNIWVLQDILRVGGKTSAELATELKMKGYNERVGDTVYKKVLVVDDASGEYDRHGGKQSPNSSSRIMRKMGFKCVHRNKNPHVKDRINAFMAKFAPVSGKPTWFYLRRNRHKVEEVLKTIKTKENNPNNLDKSDGVDHDFDACTYPIAYFEPAARVDQIQGYAANAR